MPVSEKDREYMRRIGAYKTLSRNEEQVEHLALSIGERLRRSAELSVRYRDRARPAADEDDASELYDRARRLGLYRP
jgi:hypothetical protein